MCCIKPHCLLKKKQTSWWILFNLSMSLMITHRQGILSHLTAGQSHEVWGVEPFIHGGPLASVNNEEQLIVPGETDTIMYILKQYWWENTQLAYRSSIRSNITGYITNLQTIFHSAVAMVTKKNQPLHPLPLTHQRTQILPPLLLSSFPPFFLR